MHSAQLVCSAGQREKTLNPPSGASCLLRHCLSCRERRSEDNLGGSRQSPSSRGGEGQVPTPTPHFATDYRMDYEPPSDKQLCHSEPDRCSPKISAHVACSLHTGTCGKNIPVPRVHCPKKRFTPLISQAQGHRRSPMQETYGKCEALRFCVDCSCRDGAPTRNT